MSHQISPKNNHEPIKLNEKTSNVHLHCASTSVVKMSCRNRHCCRETFDRTMLQSPFLRIARRRYFRVVPGRNARLRLLPTDGDWGQYTIGVVGVMGVFGGSCPSPISIGGIFSNGLRGSNLASSRASGDSGSIGTVKFFR
uniref:Uncharacterized protein n=1 Tax=Anopheles albimanus TaxID=7167 RepID=A0A182FZ24_ANOAL